MVRPGLDTTRDAVPIPPLKSRHDIPVPEPTAPSAGGVVAPRDPRAASQAATTSSCSTCIRRASLSHESSHSADHRDDEVGGRRGVLLELDPAGRVVHPSELEGRGQVDRRLGRAPLRRGDEARALARAVEDRTARRQRPGERVLGEHQARSPRSVRARDPPEAAARRGGSSRARGRPRRRRARSWWDRWAGTRSRFPGRGRAAWAHPTSSVTLGGRAKSRPAAARGLDFARPTTRCCGYDDPRGVVARDAAPRADARGVGRRTDRGHRGARSGSTGSARHWPRTTWSRRRASRRRRPPAGARPGVRRAPPHGPRRVEPRAVRRPGRPGPGRALRLPDARDDPGHAARPAPLRRTAGPGSTATTR